MKETALIHTNMIIDYDLALWKLLKDKYNGSYINKLLLDLDDETVKMMLVERKEMNPLTLLLNDTITEENKNKLYDEFMTTKKHELINYLCLYENILFVIKRLNESTYTDIQIVYSDDIEKKFLDDLVFDKININEVNYENYNAIFTKDSKDVEKNFENYFGKNIYLAMIGYNCHLDDRGNLLLDKDFTKLIFKKININIIALYVFNEEKIILG